MVIAIFESACELGFSAWAMKNLGRSRRNFYQSGNGNLLPKDSDTRSSSFFCPFPLFGLICCSVWSAGQPCLLFRPVCLLGRIFRICFEAFDFLEKDDFRQTVLMSLQD